MNLKLNIALNLIIVLLGLTLYYNTLDNEYALDDKAIITQNKFTKKGFDGISDLLTTSYWEGIDKNVRSYRPLAPVTFAVEVGLLGFKPEISHFFNIVIYIITGLFLFLLLKKLLKNLFTNYSEFLAFSVTLLYLAHPIHTEVVANIKSRDAMFEFLFLISSFYFLLVYIEKNNIKNIVFSTVFFFLALLSKESAISFIIMVPIILVLLKKSDVFSKIKIWVIYFIPVLFYLFLYYQYSNIQSFERLHFLDNSLIGIESNTNLLATKFYILFKYITLLIYPSPLVYDYSFNQIPEVSFTSFYALLGVLLYSFIAIFAITTFFKKLLNKEVSSLNILITIAIAWFFMGFLASSNLFFLIGSTMGERFMYSPSLGFIIIFAYFIHYIITNKLFEKNKSKEYIYLSLITIIIIFYFIKTTERNKDWKNDFTLFSSDIKNLKNNIKANDFLANIYRSKGDLEKDLKTKNEYYNKAVELKENAIKINPKVPEIQQELAFLYGNVGRFEDAVNTYKTAISMNPNEFLNYLQIGKAYGLLQKPNESIVYLLKGAKITPNDAEVWMILGISYAQTLQMEKALECFNKSIQINPNNEQVKAFIKQIKNNK